jgi:hypothetical protein
MTIFWDICNLAEVDRRFRSAYCLHNQGDSWVYFNETTRRYYYETTRSSEDLKSRNKPLGFEIKHQCVDQLSNYQFLKKKCTPRDWFILTI